MNTRLASNSFRCLTFAFLLACAPSAVAHDSWLIVDNNIAADGDTVWLSFVTGEVFPFGERATDPRRVAAFLVRHKDRTETITGYAPKDAGLSVRRTVSGGGIHVIGCALKPHLIEMKPEDFEGYLRSERAEAALSRLADTDPPSDKRIVEEYTKFAKTIVEVRPGDDEDDAWKTPIGHRLEIVPMSNPCHWKVGQAVQVRVLLDGHPWPDVPVSLGHEGADPGAKDGKAAKDKTADDHTHEYACTTRTDAKGVASIKLERAGHAFIKAHYIRPTDGLGRAKWESFWASLTFRVSGQTDVGGELRSIRGVHGRLSPGAVIGYRMGLAALRQLDLPTGDDALLVRHICPFETPYASVVDGIQAATGASLGRLSLWIDRVESFADMRTVFINQRTGETLRMDYRDEWLKLLAQTNEAFEIEALAFKAATLPDDVLFAMTTSSPSASPPAPIETDETSSDVPAASLTRR